MINKKINYENNINCYIREMKNIVENNFKKLAE